jgi:hypothetical protein
MLRCDVELLQKEFVPGLSKLDPANILAFERDDPRIASTPEARKLSVLLLINPVHPGSYEGSGSSEVEIVDKGKVG